MVVYILIYVFATLPAILLKKRFLSAHSLNVHVAAHWSLTEAIKTHGITLWIFICVNIWRFDTFPFYVF